MRNKWILLWILFSMLCLNFNTWNAWVFDDSSTWNYSVNKKITDFNHGFVRMVPAPRDFTDTHVYRWYNLADLNGDGLVDVLYHRYEFWNNYNNYNSMRQTAVLYNKWNYQFSIGYKCMERFAGSTYAETNATLSLGFYGDCAQ